MISDLIYAIIVFYGEYIVDKKIINFHSVA